MQPAPPATPEEIDAVCRRLAKAGTRGRLLALLAAEIRRYSLFDLQKMRSVVEHELRHLPPSYFRRLYPKTIEQLFGAHHELLCLSVSGNFPGADDPLDERFLEYCEMVARSSDRGIGDDPALTLLYYLIAAGTIFVLRQPGHPVGTPFPGGMTVVEIGGTYYCPIRDKEDDVETAICPWCVAKQTGDDAS